MGDRRKRALRVQFDGKRKLEYHGTKLTSDAGLLAFRELDEAFRLTEKASILLSKSRQGKNTQHTMLAMLRQAIYGRLAGYEDVNDAKRLRVDPAMRRVVGGRATEKVAASCRNFKDNHARLQLFALAYNLGNFLRRLALPRSVKRWSLTTLWE